MMGLIRGTMSAMQEKPTNADGRPGPRRAAGPVVGQMFRVFWALILAVVTGLIYYNARHNPYFFDDIPIILQHPDVHQPDGWRTLWAHDYWLGTTEDKNLYRPVTILSYHINGKLLGYEPVAFRAVNIALLAMIGVISAAWASRYIRREAAWLASFVFVCHPANIESINYLVGRADLQALLGVVLFLYVQRNMIERGKWSPTGIATATAAALLAVGSKESGLVLVPAAIMQAWVCGWLSRHAAAGSHILRGNAFEPLSLSSGLLLLSEDEYSPVETPRGKPRVELEDISQTKHNWLKSALLGGGHLTGTAIALIASLLYLLARAAVVGTRVDYTNVTDDLTANPLRNLNFIERLPGAMQAAWLYTRQAFFPDISYWVTPEVIGGWDDPRTIAGLLICAVGLLIVLMLARARHWLAIVVTLAAAHYLIVGQLLTPIGVFAANRLTLPFSLAASLLLGAFVHKAITKAMIGRLTGGSFVKQESRSSQLLAENPWIGPGVFAALLVVMAATVARGNQQWRNELERAMSDRGREEGHVVCLYYAGTALANVAGDHYSPTILARAEKYLEAAATKRPDSAQVMMQLAGVRVKQLNFEGAEQAYRAALKTSPDNSYAAERLGAVLMVRGDYSSAETYLLQADKARPGNPDILYNLAELAKARGRFTEANRRYIELIKAFPQHEAAKKKYEEFVRYLAQESP